MWRCAVDYVLEVIGLKKDSDEGMQMYEKYLKERKTFIYNTVKVEDGDKITSEYNVLEKISGPEE